jgi:hypothetical protein
VKRTFSRTRPNRSPLAATTPAGEENMIKTALFGVLLVATACDPCVNPPTKEPGPHEASFGWIVFADGKAQPITVDASGVSHVTVPGTSKLSVFYSVKESVGGISHVHVGQLSESSSVPDGTYNLCLEKGLNIEPNQIYDAVRMALPSVDRDTSTATERTAQGCATSQLPQLVNGSVFENKEPGVVPCPDGYDNVGAWRVSLRAKATDGLGTYHSSKPLVIDGTRQGV